MRRRILVFAGIAGAALIAVQAQARRHGPPPLGGGAARAVMAMLHGGDLSEAQHEQVRARLDSGREGAKATRDELRAANQQLTAQLLAATPPDEAALRAALEKIETLRATLLDQQVETALAVRGMLSAEQLAAAAAATPPARECRHHGEP
jgi:Spy/CpxP family protein refolding chaperone